MFNLFAEHRSEGRRQELLRLADETHLVAQAFETGKTQRPSLPQTVRLWVVAGMDWSGSRLIQFGTALRRVHEEPGLQDQAQTAKLCQDS